MFIGVLSFSSYFLLRVFLDDVLGKSTSRSDKEFRITIGQLILHADVFSDLNQVLSGVCRKLALKVKKSALRKPSYPFPFSMQSLIFTVTLRRSFNEACFQLHRQIPHYPARNERNPKYCSTREYHVTCGPEKHCDKSCDNMYRWVTGSPVKSALERWAEEEAEGTHRLRQNQRFSSKEENLQTQLRSPSLDKEYDQIDFLVFLFLSGAKHEFLSAIIP